MQGYENGSFAVKLAHYMVRRVIGELVVNARYGIARDVSYARAAVDRKAGSCMLSRWPPLQSY